MPSTSAESDEKSQATQRVTSDFNQNGKTTAADTQLEEALVEPTEITQGSSSEEDRNKAKAQIEEIVNRLMKNPNEPSKAALTIDDIIPVIVRARESLMLDAALIELEAPIVIVGDLHGQFSDAMAIFVQNGNPPTQKYLFLGDYIDRGEYSIETVVLLLGLKLLFPDSIFLLRGNHECRAINRVYGFYDEVVTRFTTDLWELFQLTFNCLPICARISGKIFCMHGGLSRDLNSWQMFSDIRRPVEIPTYGVLCDLLWADPTNENVQFGPSARGISSTFGEEYVIQFCKDLNLDMVVRAHQVVMDGYEFFASRRMITIFSAPYYCKEFGNSGAVLVVSKDLECRVNVRFPKGIIFEEAGNEEETPAAETTPADPSPASGGVTDLSPQPSFTQDQQKLKEKPKTVSPLSKTSTSKTSTSKGSTPKASTPPTSPSTTPISPKISTEKSPTASPAATPKKPFDNSRNFDDDSLKNRKLQIPSTRTTAKMPPTSTTGSSEKVSTPKSYCGGSAIKKDQNVAKKKSGSTRQMNDRSNKTRRSPSKKKKGDDENADKSGDSCSVKKVKPPRTAFEQKMSANNESKKIRKKKTHRSKGSAGGGGIDQSQKNYSDDYNSSEKKKSKKPEKILPKSPDKRTAAEHLAAIQNRPQTPGPTTTNRETDKTKK